MKNCLAALLLLLLAACAGTPFKWEDVKRLKEGMSPQEVQAIMGAPYMVTANGRETKWVWSYSNGMTGRTKAASVIFIDGILVRPNEVPFND